MYAQIDYQSRRLLPSFQPTGRPLRTGKCLVRFGTAGHQQVVVKQLKERHPYWVERFGNEVSWYRHFSRSLTPVSVPKLIAVDEKRQILITTRATGEPLSRERYLLEPLPTAPANALLRTLNTLHRWYPRQKTTVKAVQADYVSRLHKYVGSGALPLLSSTVAHLTEQIQDISWHLEFNHGDLLLSNCLLHHGRITVIDWEFAGYYLPGYDLALLWLFLAPNDPMRNGITQYVAAQSPDCQQAFDINRLILIGRELRIHRASADMPTHTQRIERLTQDLQEVSNQLPAA